MSSPKAVEFFLLLTDCSLDLEYEEGCGKNFFKLPGVGEVVFLQLDYEQGTQWRQMYQIRQQLCNFHLYSSRMEYPEFLFAQIES